MIFHDDYAQVPPAEVDRFVASQELGRLITVGASSFGRVRSSTCTSCARTS